MAGTFNSQPSPLSPTVPDGDPCAREGNDIRGRTGPPFNIQANDCCPYFSAPTGQDLFRRVRIGTAQRESPRRSTMDNRTAKKRRLTELEARACLRTERRRQQRNRGPEPGRDREGRVHQDFLRVVPGDTNEPEMVYGYPQEAGEGGQCTFLFSSPTF